MAEDQEGQVSVSLSLGRRIRERVFSTLGFSLTIAAVALFGLLLSGLIYRQSLHDYDTALQNHRQTSRAVAGIAADKINDVFAQIYQNLRTIGRLPSVRAIDRHGGNLSENDKTTIQEIYNNLASNVAVSEVYILPVGFNPEAVDHVTGQPEAPIMMFDHLIVGRTGGETKEDEEPSPVEEVEIHEYRQMAKTLEWLRANHGVLGADVGMGLPAVAGAEVITCDNSRYDPVKPDDKDRSGIVYSVPFYDANGVMRGMVSAIMLTAALQDLLPEGGYALVNPAHDQKIMSRQPYPELAAGQDFIARGEAVPGLLYSEAIPLSVRDAQGGWTLVTAQPDAVFLESGRVRTILEYRYFGSGVTLLFAFAGIVMLVSLRRGYRREKKALIRARDRAELLSRERAEFLTNVINSTVDALITISETGTIETFNPAAEKIFGYKRDEALGKNIKVLMPEPHHSRHDDYLRNYRETGKAKIMGVGVEAEGRRRNGEIFPVEISISEAQLPRRRVFTGILRDISERKESERRLQERTTELERARAAAEQATRLKSEFLANMSHEIRTPMNGIIGMTNLLLGGELNTTERGYAQTVMRSAESLLALLNDILDFSKIEAGKIDLERIPFDFQVLCEEICDSLTPKAVEKRLELLLYYPSDAPRYVMGDPGRVRQIFMNLIGNALKFTEKGHVLARVNVSESADQSGKIVFSVDIEDTGIGIPEDRRDYIFNKFVQVDGSTTRKFGGTGLGLAICKDLAHMMGGDVGVRGREEGQGSVFWFTLALDRDPEGKPLDLPKGISLRGTSILVVDDNPTALEIIARSLTAEGVSVVTAQDGAEALALIGGGGRFDAAVLDFMMPGMDGFELGQKIRQHQACASLPLVMLTSAPMRGDSRKMEEAGFAAYLNKPLGNWYLRDALKIVIAGARSGQRLPLVTRHNIRESSSPARTVPGGKLLFRDAHVLLAEDNPTNLEVATALLRRYGCTVTPAGNGREALEQMTGRRFDMVFMDCQMPVMDGYEATAAIRQMEKDRGLSPTPIVAFTANALKGDDVKCKNAGMDDYISKPVRKADMERVLGQWLSADKRVDEK